jgi:hypothetical protein
MVNRALLVVSLGMFRDDAVPQDLVERARQLGLEDLGRAVEGKRATMLEQMRPVLALRAGRRFRVSRERTDVLERRVEAVRRRLAEPEFPARIQVVAEPLPAYRFDLRRAAGIGLTGLLLCLTAAGAGLEMNRTRAGALATAAALLMLGPWGIPRRAAALASSVARSARQGWRRCCRWAIERRQTWLSWRLDQELARQVAADSWTSVCLAHLAGTFDLESARSRQAAAR